MRIKIINKKKKEKRSNNFIIFSLYQKTMIPWNLDVNRNN